VAGRDRMGYREQLGLLVGRCRGELS